MGAIFYISAFTTSGGTCPSATVEQRTDRVGSHPPTVAPARCPATAVARPFVGLPPSSRRMFTMFSGKMKIEICEARKLRATDKQRKFWKEKEEPTLDPYVQLDVDELHLARTTTKLKTSDPVWNECFIHEVQQAVFLGLTIFHDAVLPPDYFIANCNIPFTELVKNLYEGINDFWVSSPRSAPLVFCLKHSAGVCVCVHSMCALASCINIECNLSWFSRLLLHLHCYRRDMIWTKTGS